MTLQEVQYYLWAVRSKFPFFRGCPSASLGGGNPGCLLNQFVVLVISAINGAPNQLELALLFLFPLIKEALAKLPAVQLHACPLERAYLMLSSVLLDIISTQLKWHEMYTS